MPSSLFSPPTPCTRHSGLARGVARAVMTSSLVLGAACGGADKQDVLDAPSAAMEGSSTSSSSSGSPSSSGSAPGTSSGASSGSPPGSSSGATSSSGGIAGCPSESESNDRADDANDIAESLCGVIADKGDTDFLTFDLPGSAKTVKLTFEGRVTLDVTVGGGGGGGGGGKSVTLEPGSNQGIPFVRGGTYVIRVRAESRAEWRVNVAFAN